MLYIDQHILNKSKKDEKSSYGLGWLQKVIWYGSTKLDSTLSQDVQNSTLSHKPHRKTMQTWRVELTAGGRSIAETTVQIRIFQGDALSHLLFIIAMMTLNHILRKCTAGYKFSTSQEKINHLIYIDDIKLFAKYETEMETLIHAVKIYNQDIGMEFGIEKMCHARHEKWAIDIWLTKWNYQIKKKSER